jgi:maltooligosyltrehalose trehalohydrolase
MGEEYGETAPFQFFTSFEDQGLATAVREGRKREIAGQGDADNFADPQAPGTLEQSRLDWSKPAISPHSEILNLYRDLITLRKRHPSLGNCRKDLTEIHFDEQSRSLVMRRSDPSGGAVLLVCNFSGDAQDISVAPDPREWQLVLWSGSAAYGGSPAHSPAQTLAADSDLRVSLAAFESAIYSTSRRHENLSRR